MPFKSQRWWLTTDSRSIDIDAPAERVYDLVADLSRMGEWSPECRRVEWLDGATSPAAPGIGVISSSASLPGMGTLAINAFVVHGAEPLLVDTGTVAEADEFLSVLRTVIDPAQLRWVFLTHTDFDHIGALPRLLADN